MATYLYCLLPAPAAADAVPRGLVGIADAPVRALVVDAGGGAIAAWVATLRDDVLRTADRRDLAALAVTHDAVVQVALETGQTPLPARFGQRFADDAACIADIRRRAASLRGAVARVAGCVEMSVLLVEARAGDRLRASVPASETSSRVEQHAGRRYLESLRERARLETAQHAEAQAELARVTGLVAPLVRAGTMRRDSRGMWSVSHLVPRESVNAYQERVAGLVASGQRRFVVAGPRAPYSFAGDPSELGSGHDSGSLISSD